jgi:DNA polymerase-1
VTSTGRLSSSDPNLQNIPIRGEWGRELRLVFEAGPKKVLMSSDYSQIELRILAHLSGDASLKEAFNKGEDIHSATARNIFGASEITPDMRRRAKTINFGIIYGMTSFGLARELGITPDEAQGYIDRYMQRFPKVKEYLEFLIEEARKNGFAKTLLGRKRPMKGADIERIAVNTPIQGSAADIIKLAMVKIDDKLRCANLKTNMLLQVHDELLFEVPENELARIKEIVKSSMENAYRLSVGLEVNISWGKRWGEIE